MRALFESVNLIGDALYISPALRAWIIRTQLGQPKSKLDMHVDVLTLNDHVAPLYPGMVRDMGHVHLNTIYDHLDEVEAQKYDFRWKFNVNDAFAMSDQKKQHIAQSYADLLGVELKSYAERRHWIPAYKPTFIPEPRKLLPEIQNAVLISMFSASCTSRDKNTPGLPPNKMLPFDKWPMILTLLRHRFPASPIKLLGAPTDEIPPELTVLCNDLMIVPMFGIPLNNLACIMRDARLLVTIDNGMSHLAASQETPTFLMYPICLSTSYILPIGNPNLIYIQMNPVTVKVDRIIMALDFALQRFEKEKKNE